jgi:macrolide transport system ATP-binding/permease protein
MTEVNAAGTTIVQVTHDDKVAAYGRRVIELRDGMLVEDRRD